MKKIVMLMLLLITLASYAAFVKEHKSTYTQPNGEVINLTTSGDEFYRQVKDQDGYTVLRNNEDGYLYYAVLKDGNLVLSDVKVSQTNKSRSTQFRKDISISQEEYISRREASYPENESMQRSERAFAGNLKNLVVFVYWPGSSQFSSSEVSSFEKLYNGTSSSVKDYYSKISYGKSTVESFVTPAIQIESPHARAKVADETVGIEKFLYDVLKKAITDNKIPSNLVLDGNNDGIVDNVTFWIQGISGEWSSALWPQKNWLSGSTYGNLTINGKKVYDVVSSPVDRKDFPTAAHELGHAYGAPDLYSYTNQSTSATGPWDNMSSVVGPVHCTAFLNSQYFGWVDQIKTIQPGTHTISALANSSSNSAFRIDIPGRTDEYLVVENRYKTGYDAKLPESGLVVYRIHPRGNDNWGFPKGNAYNEPYEIYAFRPYDNIFTGDEAALGKGNKSGFNEASFNLNADDDTGIRLFTTENKDPGIRIYNVSASGASMTFSYEYYTPTVNNTIVNLDYASSVGAYGAYGTDLVKMGVKLATTDFKGAKKIKGIRFYAATYEDNTISSCKVNVVKGGANPEAGTKIYTGTISSTNYKIDNWNEHTLSTPIDIEANTTYWLSLEIKPSKETTIYCADSGPSKKTKNYMYYQGWADISTWGGSWDANLNIQAVVDGTGVGINEEATSLNNIDLLQNYPNPFNPTTTISFATKNADKINLSIFNAKGELVKELLNQNIDKGQHSISFDGSALNSGIYFAVIKGAEQTMINKMVLLK